jgi:hypothetical protein
MSHMERGLTVVKIAHSVHEKIPENTVWRAGKRILLVTMLNGWFLMHWV